MRMQTISLPGLSSIRNVGENMDSVHGREGECLLYVWYDRGSSPPPQCCPSACKLTGAGGGGAYMGECLETSGDGIPYGGGHPGHGSSEVGMLHQWVNTQVIWGDVATCYSSGLYYFM